MCFDERIQFVEAVITYDEFGPVTDITNSENDLMCGKTNFSIIV